MAYLYRVVFALLLSFASLFAWAVDCTQYRVGNLWQTSEANDGWASDEEGAIALFCTRAGQTGCYRPPAYPQYIHYPCGASVCSFGEQPTVSRTGNYCADVNACEALGGQPPNFLTCSGTYCSYYVKGTGATTSAPEGSVPQPLLTCIPDAAGAGKNCLAGGRLELGWYDSSVQMWGVRMTDVAYTGMPCTVGGATPSPGTVTGSGTGTGTVTVPLLTEDKAGKCPGTVNGVEVWVTCDKSMTPGTYTTTTFEVTPDGTKTYTVTGGTVTTCTNGVCTTVSTTTTTVTVTPSAGGIGSSTTTVSGGTSTGSLSGFCDQPGNSSLAICEGEGAFGGACNTGFSCTGDAVLCATAKATNEQKCLLSKESDEGTLYNSVKTNTTTTGIGTETIAINASSFDQSNALGVSSCIPDKTITIAMSNFSKTLTLPFSVLCPYLEQLGNVLVAVAMLGAMFIVFRRS